MGRWRDDFPLENRCGEGHSTGSDCACNPWAFWGDDGMIVVVHGMFTEKIIHTSEPAAYDDEVVSEVEWEVEA